MGSPCARAGAGDHTPRGARPQGAELHGAVAEEASWVDGRRPWRTTLTERSRMVYRSAGITAHTRRIANLSDLGAPIGLLHPPL